VATYVFAWNPKLWGWPELGREIGRLRKRGHLDIQWASGRTRAIEPGSRAFIVRLGVAPKGIIGSGVTLTAPEPGVHWVAAKRKAGVPALYLKLRLEVLSETPLIGFDELATPPYSRFRWGVRASGTGMPSQVADALENLWEPRAQAWQSSPKLSAASPAKAGKARGKKPASADRRAGSRRRGRRD
jgi:5-methylcytosine-specific restriction protein A